MESQAYLNLLAGMPEVEDKLRLLYRRYGDPTEEVHAAYTSWLADMAGRPGTTLQPFGLDLEANPEQSVWLPMSEPHDPHAEKRDGLYFAGFSWKMAKSLGALGLSRIVHQIKHQPGSAEDSTPLHERLLHNQREGKNTLIATSHFQFQEMGYFRASRIIAKRDRNIHNSGAVFNNLMSRQAYKGRGEPIKLVDLFTPTGYVVWTGPKSKSSDKFGVPLAARNLINALASLSLEPKLEEGGQEVDIALAGSEVKPIYDADGKNVLHYVVPDVDPASAKLLERFDEVLAATLIKSPLTGQWEMEIGQLLDINELLSRAYTGKEIVDMLYTNSIVPAIEKITRKEVEYNRLASTRNAMGRLAMASEPVR